jgi:hypothetical protein
VASDPDRALPGEGHPSPRIGIAHPSPLDDQPDTFDYLASLEWIVTYRNVAFVGPTGTGKSHLSVALGRAAAEAGFRVRFFRADLLIEALCGGLSDDPVGRLIEAILRRRVPQPRCSRVAVTASMATFVRWSCSVGSPLAVRGVLGDVPDGPTIPPCHPQTGGSL